MNDEINNHTTAGAGGSTNDANDDCCIKYLDLTNFKT
jgi:hypothetical protein